MKTCPFANYLKMKKLKEQIKAECITSATKKSGSTGMLLYFVFVTFQSLDRELGFIRPFW